MFDGEGKTTLAAWTVATRGRFKISGADGQDETPANRKLRGVVALLAASDDRRQSRLWLQSMLWSASPPEKAANSLRTALKTLRATFSDPPLLGANRNEVWLDAGVRIHDDAEGPGPAELFELVDAPDPAFDEWLRDVRTRDAQVNGPAPVAPPLLPASDSRTMIVIRSNSALACARAHYLEAVLADTLSASFATEGAEEIYVLDEPAPEQMARATSVIHVELVSVVEGDSWSVHLRALSGAERRFLWSGRAQFPAQTEPRQLSLNIAGFVSRAIAQISLKYAALQPVRDSALMVMARAASRLYDPSLRQVEAAEQDLASLMGGEATAIALAWRGFAKLVRILEFRDASQVEEAQAMVFEAHDTRPDNAMVATMSARVAMDLTGDLEHADWLVQRALRETDTNPYLLKAAARIAMKQGRYQEAHQHATLAKSVAVGLPHVFAWDIELCLTALSQGAFAEAHDAARLAHRSNTRHRASLRYLVATSLLVGDRFEAEHAAKRLRDLEAGFEIAHLFNSNYPIHTLQNLGLVEELRRMTAAT